MDNQICHYLISNQQPHYNDILATVLLIHESVLIVYTLVVFFSTEEVQEWVVPPHGRHFWNSTF